MNGLAVLLSVAVIGVDYGWQPAPNGQLEYIIQIEPNLIETMRAGSEIVSEIHPDARGVRRFRIRIGTGPLPRLGGSAAAAPGSGAAPSGSRSVIPPNTGSPTGQANVPRLSDSRANQSWSSSGTSTQPHVSAPPLLTLPPPPWTLDEQAQMRSVLVGGRQGSRDATNNAAAGTGKRADVLPPNMSGQSNISGQSNQSTNMGAHPGGSWQPPTGMQPFNNRATGATPGPTIGATLFGPAQPPSNASPATGISPPNLAISPPRFDLGPQPPIRDPDARAKNGGAQGKTRIASQPNHPKKLPTLLDIVKRENKGTEGRHSLVSRLSEMDNPKSVASTKPELDQQTAERLAELQAKPWFPLIVTSMLLFASLAANAYLGWIAVGVYRRYRDVVRQLRRATTATI